MAIVAVGAGRLRPTTLLLAACLLPFAVPASAKVGVTSAVDNDPLGKPPNDNERVLRIGIDVQANEIITTAARDRAHLVFLDGSALTVGPNARVTIDRFVYDPNSGTGELAVNASVGVLRFVGGKISKKGTVTVRTPSSTIGIRGGIAIFVVTQVRTVSDFIFGSSMAVTAAGVTQTATRPGSQIITSLGGPPAAPTLLKPGSLNAALNQLQGSSSGGGTAATGGSPAAPGGSSPDAVLQKSGYANTNSGQNPGTVGSASQNLPPNPNNNALTTAVSDAGQANQPADSTLDNPPARPGNNQPPPPQPKVIVTDGRFLRELPYKPDTFNAKTLTAKPDRANNQALQPTGTVLNQTATLALRNGDTLQVPWLPGQIFSFSGVTPFGPANGVGFVDQAEQFFAYSLTEVNGKRQFGLFGGTPTAAANFPKQAIGAQQLVNLNKPGNLPFAPDSVGGDAQLKNAAQASPLYSIYGSQPSTSKGLQVTLSIAGAGASQKSYMGVFIANYGLTSRDHSLYSTGTYAGSYRLGGDQKVGILASTAASAATGQGEGTAIYGDTGQYMALTPDRIVTEHGHPAGDGARQASAASAGGATRRVTGASLDQPYDNLAGNSYYPVTVAAPATSDQVNPTVGQKRTAQTLNGYVGGLVDTRSGGTYSTQVPLALLARPGDVRISTDPSTSQVLAKLVLRGYDGSLFSPAALTLQLGGGSNHRGPTSAFIDDNTYAATSHGRSTLRIGEGTYKVQSDAVLASANSAQVRIPGIGSCVCEYLSWGWWSDSSTVKNGPLKGDMARVNLGTYVAGTLTTAVQMPQTGTATYNGLMVGNVNNAGNSYVAGGSYTMNYNYAARVGVIPQMRFDNTSYVGGVAATNASGTSFGGAFAGAHGVGTLKGSFYGPGAANQGGSFSIGTGSSAYKASGVFAGQK